jgi:hypothetical protein
MPSGGIVAWNAVSKTATCGTPGRSLGHGDAGQGGRVVQRCQRHQGLDVGDHVVIDHPGHRAT